MLDVLGTVDHELAHMALDAALGGRAPRWLDEGFAYLHSSDWSFERLRTLIGMAWSGNTIPLHELDRSFPAAEQAAHKAYAQSYDFVAFLARRGKWPDADDDGDRWPFRRFLAEIASGKSTSEAALEAFSATLSDLFKEWRRNLRSRYLMVPRRAVRPRRLDPRRAPSDHRLHPQAGEEPRDPRPLGRRGSRPRRPDRSSPRGRRPRARFGRAGRVAARASGLAWRSLLCTKSSDRSITWAGSRLSIGPPEGASHKGPSGLAWLASGRERYRV